MTGGRCQKFPQYQSRLAFIFYAQYIYFRNYFNYITLVIALRNFLNYDHPNNDIEGYWKLYEVVTLLKLISRSKYDLVIIWSNYYYLLNSKDTIDKRSAHRKTYKRILQDKSYEKFPDSSYKTLVTNYLKCDSFKKEEAKKRCNSFKDKIFKEAKEEMKPFRDRWSDFNEDVF